MALNDKEGYMVVSLRNDEGKPKKCFVHRLVAITYIPNPLGKPMVNHLNRIRHDNRVVNLEWCTGSENALHAHAQPPISPPVFKRDLAYRRALRKRLAQEGYITGRHPAELP